LNTAIAQNASIEFFSDQNYPTRLKPLDDSPALLFAQGKPAYQNDYTIGVVGTRRPTAYGLSAIKKILSDLFPYRPTIISGLAYGVDIAAHQMALKLNLPTIGVLGSGLDYIYPQSHQSIARKMLDKGGLVTQFKFGTKPEAYHFPARNRIIAGLSDALVVVEARRKGGALITAACSRSYNRSCYAVPGPINAPASIGCNQLISQGKAIILTNGLDIVDHLNWNLPAKKRIAKPLPAIESQILQVLSDHQGGVAIDKLCRKTQTPVNKMASYLLSLEIRGYIKAAPGNKFVLSSE
jgi:DNA processing protein